jgi:predicted MFS family arabinose efflux permease
MSRVDYCGSGTWSAGTIAILIAAVSIFIWGLGFGPANSSQQARLIAADPSLASASVALNTSAIYVGQATGTPLGGRILTLGHAHMLGFLGAALVSGALIASLAASVRFRA